MTAISSVLHRLHELPHYADNGVLRAMSQKHRKKIEEAFAWAKTVGGMAQTMYRGVERVRSRFILTMAANNLARLPRLLAA
jgi:Mg/Co/Ni transporter MgtE